MAEKTKSEKKEVSPKKEGEKVLIIPLRSRTRKSSRNSRMKHSISEIRSFLSRHMRTEPSNVSVSQQLNESLTKKGFHHPPAKIKVKVSTDEEGRVFAKLLDEKEKPKVQKKKGLRERLARRREESKAGKPEEKKEEKKPEPVKESKPETGEKAESEGRRQDRLQGTDAFKPEEKKPEQKPSEKPKEPAQEIGQDILLEE